MRLDFDHFRISQLQRPTRCFSSLGSAEFCLEVTADDRREPFGGRPVGSYCFSSALARQLRERAFSSLFLHDRPDY
jgi:hypothetical protein